MTYGEEIVHRLFNLDFNKPIDKMMNGIYAGLPERMSREEATSYYTKKLDDFWKGKGIAKAPKQIGLRRMLEDVALRAYELGKKESA